MMKLTEKEQMVIDLMRKGATVELGFYSSQVSRDEAEMYCAKNGEPVMKEKDDYTWFKSEDGKVSVSAFYYGSTPEEKEANDKGAENNE